MPYNKLNACAVGLLALSCFACQSGYVASSGITDGQSANSNFGASGGSSGGGVDGLDADTAKALATDSPTVGVIRRLSNVEYNNTVRDLLHTQLTPADNFAADDLNGGFDTVGSTLQISPTRVLGYLTAAETLAQEASNPSTSPSKADFTCNTGEDQLACLGRLLSTFATQAWRRPVTEGETAQLVATALKASDSAPQSILAQGIVAVLVSPHFLFHVEIDANSSSSAVQNLDDYALASRLSYFLWSSMPDAALFASAMQGNLHEDAVLQGHIDRMLADTRSQNLVNHFAGFWLGLNRAATFTANTSHYPNFTPKLRSAMLTETQMYLQDYVLGDAPLMRMLDANYTYVNSDLAAYYGLSGVSGTDFTKVTLPTGGSAPRRGLLTQGAMLIANSDPDATNIIRRGKSVLTALLCTAVGSPPAGVANLPSASSEPNQTQRQRLEAHIINPSCAGCHNLMDPIGYAFERFGPDGKERSFDNGSPIDSSGTFSGQPFSGADGFVGLLAEATSISRCATQNLYTYALGVAPATEDVDNINHLAAAFTQTGGKMRDLIKLVAQSNVFRTRRSQGDAS